MKLLLLFSLLIYTLNAAPAFDKMREFKNADGTTFIAKGQGNQHLNWVETEDGVILRHNPKSNNYEYAEIEDNQLKASGNKYEKQNYKRANALNSKKNISKEAVYDLWGKKRAEAHKRKKSKKSD